MGQLSRSENILHRGFWSFAFCFLFSFSLPSLGKHGRWRVTLLWDWRTQRQGGNGNNLVRDRGAPSAVARKAKNLIPGGGSVLGKEHVCTSPCHNTKAVPIITPLDDEWNTKSRPWPLSATLALHLVSLFSQSLCRFSSGVSFQVL